MWRKTVWNYFEGQGEEGYELQCQHDNEVDARQEFRIRQFEQERIQDQERQRQRCLVDYSSSSSGSGMPDEQQTTAGSSRMAMEEEQYFGIRK